jgi:hypothetical protein
VTHGDESDSLTLMTKRLQVLMDEDELRTIQRLARKDRITTAEWVRQRLREAQEQRARPDLERKLAVIRAASKYRAPAPDIDQMNAEIEQGYLDDPAFR